jgi:hypothetical protein
MFLSTLNRGPAAIDQKRMADNHVCSRAGQKDNGACHILRLAQPTLPSTHTDGKEDFGRLLFMTGFSRG